MENRYAWSCEKAATGARSNNPVFNASAVYVRLRMRQQPALHLFN